MPIKRAPSPTRAKARAEILAAANAAHDGRPLTMRHLNRCVCIVRRRGLVKSSVLVAAGFRPSAVAR